MFFSMYPKVAYDIYGNGVKRALTNLAAYSTIQANKKLLDNATFYKNFTIPEGARPDNVSQMLYGTPEYYWTFFIVNDHLKNYYQDWPKTFSSLREFVEDKYPSLVGIAKAPDGVISNGDENFAGYGRIGEIFQGQISKARVRLTRKYPTQGYIALEPVQGIVRAGGEALTGVTSGDTIVCTSFVKEAYAPHHHLDRVTGEKTERNNTTVPVSYFDIEKEMNNENSFIRVIKPEFIGDVAREFAKSMQG